MPQDVANRSFLKSYALYKTIDNRKILEEQKIMIPKRLDEALAARNKLYEASQQHHLVICDMKHQIKNLEEERSNLQEENSRLLKQLQTTQAYKHSIFCPDFALSYQFLRYLPMWMWLILKKSRQVASPWWSVWKKLPRKFLMS